MKTIPHSCLSFCPDQTAAQAHKSLISALETQNAAHQCSLDWFGEIFDRKLYRELGYSSINQYAKEALGFSKTKIGDYIKLTRKVKKLPHLKDALNKGKLGYTSGRLIADIADEESEKEWVGFALDNPRKVVEEEVKRAKLEAKEKVARQPSFLPARKKKTPAAVVPVRVLLEMSPTQFARYESMWEQVRKQQDVSSEKVEALLEIMASFLNSVGQVKTPRGAFFRVSSEAGIVATDTDTVLALAVESTVGPTVESTEQSLQQSNQQPATLPPYQINIHHCPECDSTVVQTSKGEMAIGKSEWERAQCDCKINQPGQRNTASIPPSTRRKVLTRARNKCEMPGCDHTRFLEVHHKVPRVKGGTNDQANLQVLCSGCHSLIHKRGLGFQIKEMGAVYGWRSGKFQGI